MQVRRRHVLFIPGYDPRPPRRYRELYRAEAAAQAAVSGHRIAIAARRGLPNLAWDVDACIEGARVHATVEILAWNDLIRDRLRRPIPWIYAMMLVTLWRFLASGALVAMARLRPGPLIAGLAPVGFLLAYLAVAAVAGWAAARGAALGGLPPVAGWGAGLAAFAATMAATRLLEPWTFAYYLVTDFAHVAEGMGVPPPDLAARLSQFADRLRAVAAEGDVDEVLLVGHSSGAHLAVSVMAGALARGVAQGPALSLLTLGQAIPMASFLPRARALRRDLGRLACCRRIVWVDVSAPGDGACFALCDPVAVSGVAPPGQLWPLVVSAAFSRTLSPRRLRALRWRHFRRHLQYLCAFDRPGRYDWFAITAGPRTLGDRFAGAGHSPSRVTVPVSPHRSIA
ncbi:MAG: hypothetical protein KatS3mg118_3038 [Paracoccaceae bacterium]|nr:MAG: hypothetical protein KatS3mg118_3038 [Paracoccaceae bacterium]